MMLLAAGCMLPSANFLPAYVVNRDGAYYVGERCRPDLVEAAVSMSDALVDGGKSVDLSRAFWHAVGDPVPVSEFELFASTQKGVNVVFDSGARPLSEDVHIYVRADHEPWRDLALPLGNIEVGNVASYAGRMTWEQFMAMPDRDFGC